MVRPTPSSGESVLFKARYDGLAPKSRVVIFVGSDASPPLKRRLQACSRLQGTERFCEQQAMKLLGVALFLLACCERNDATEGSGR